MKYGYNLLLNFQDILCQTTAMLSPAAQANQAENLLAEQTANIRIIKWSVNNSVEHYIRSIGCFFKLYYTFLSKALALCSLIRYESRLSGIKKSYNVLCVSSQRNFIAANISFYSQLLITRDNLTILNSTIFSSSGCYLVHVILLWLLIDYQYQLIGMVLEYHSN